ncbi:MAG: NifU family protein, partial [Paracoccaceae bacterium]|nr:NifU family protein [Paracoccaceae bacterium]
MRFILEAPIEPGRAIHFEGPQANAPLATALFDVDGVQKVVVSAETILVTCAPGHDWRALKTPVAAAIRQVLGQTDHPLGDATNSPGQTDDAALLAQANEVLDRQANPSIAKHRGRVTAESVEDGVLYLRMSGGCHGCAASARTLRDGVEKILRAALPSIREIVDVTDHATGQNPFYQDKPGQSPAFTRLVPADCIAWEDGQLTIDPDYLAPRLGLTPDQLQAGLETGDVTITTSTAPGTDADRTRVIVRGPQRAWAADVLPDGTAREVPPPRQPTIAEQVANDLPHRVRAHLDALPADPQLITYGRLARALGMYAPGSVRKVTAALETTMREDAAAGRTFLAARVVSRGPAQSPGKGFFELARALGRGP